MTGNQSIDFIVASNRQLLNALFCFRQLDKTSGNFDDSRKTQLRNFCGVKRFIEYLVYLKKIDQHPILDLKRAYYFKVPRKLPRFLNVKEVNSLLYAINSPLVNPNAHSDYAIRDKAIFELIYATGMRVSELVQLRLQNIDLKNRII